MKLVVDNKIALIEQLQAYADVVALDSSAIIAAEIKDADALIVRTETQVNQQLLAGSRVQFVGSATIGRDHVDEQYLTERGIGFANAPGCNARAVVEYVIASLFSLYSITELQTKRLGIVGCGNIGSKLYQLLNQLNIPVCYYDPFLMANGVSFATILNCDIISLHTPLTQHGEYPTHHLFDSDELNQMAGNACLINTSRGAVVNNYALLKHLEQYPNFNAVLDVWENEPNINSQLLDRVTIATPHIAGYSQRGKHQATIMVLNALLNFFDITPASTNSDDTNKRVIDVSGLSVEQGLLKHFNPMPLSQHLKKNYQQPSDFKQQRSNYPFRAETDDIEWKNISIANQQLKII